MLGNGQQRVMLVPELGVVVTLFAGYYGELARVPDRLLVDQGLAWAAAFPVSPEGPP